MATLGSALKEAKELLRTEGINDWESDAWYLLEYFFRITRVNYLVNTEKAITSEEYYEYFQLVHKRAAKIPLQYITGIQWFMGLDFNVNAGVLIPRQDTELLVEAALDLCKDKSVLDMCTGSGCIITALSKLSDLQRAVGVDISDEAVETARKNVRKHSADVEIIQSNLFEQIQGRFDLIISNPPYIETKIIDELMAEVKEHEPLIALDGREDGLYFYRCITRESKKFFNDDGYILYEIGYNQGKEVSNILKSEDFTGIKVIKDLAGHDRVVIGRYCSGQNSMEES